MAVVFTLMKHRLSDIFYQLPPLHFTSFINSASELALFRMSNVIMKGFDKEVYELCKHQKDFS